MFIVVCWRYRMPFDTNGCISTLMNVEVGVNDSTFYGNEQQKVKLRIGS